MKLHKVRRLLEILEGLALSNAKIRQLDKNRTPNPVVEHPTLERTVSVIDVHGNVRGVDPKEKTRNLIGDDTLAVEVLEIRNRGKRNIIYYVV